MAIKLTKRTVDQAVSQAVRTTIWDSELKGFGLVVQPSGVKTYTLVYRMGGRSTKPERYTIGRHGDPWTPDEARGEARRLLLMVANGVNPRSSRAAKRATGKTVKELCDRFIAEHVEPKTRPRTAKEYRRLIETAVKPRLGSRAAADVTRADVSDLHHRMRGTPRQANLMLSVLSKMFNLAEVWGLRPDHSNPCRQIQRYEESRRTRFLTDAEIEGLGGALDELALTSPVPAIADSIRLLLLTGCRLGEILNLRPGDVRTADSALWISDPKGEPRLHPIGAVALAFIAELPRTGEWLFHGRDRKRPLSISTVEHAWRRIRGDIGLGDVRLHDMRHTVGTFAGQSQANAFLVRDKLGHKTLAMTGRYVSRDASPLRQLSDAIEGRVDAALKAGLGKVADVVPMPVRKRPRRA